MTTKKILLISAPIGDGHTKAAEAVAETMLSEYKDVKPIICDVFDFFSPTIGKLILNGYLKILRIFPQAYGKMYNAGNENSLALKAREFINRYLSGRMSNFILEHNPELIICTHATAAGLAADLKKQGKLKIPLVAVITDYVVHRLWVYPEFDRYFVATAEMAEYLAAHGVKKDHIKVTGIPIRPAFCRAPDKQTLYNKLELAEDKPTLLIMGGGAGILPMPEILENLNNKINNLLKLQVIIVTGKNKSMYEHLSSYLNKTPHQVKLCGYVDNVHELMAVSDILITKPGGMTSAEALSSNLPLIIYRPLPGQEEANARYLTGKGAAVLINSPEELTTALEQILINEPDKLAKLKQKAAAIKQPYAAFDILNNLGRYLTPGG